MRILSSEQMRAVEREALKHSQTYLRLMENAGTGAAKMIARCESPIENRRCVVLCGKGNNGGDGFVVARKLCREGAIVTCVLAGGEPRSEEAREMLRLLSLEPVSVLPLEEDHAQINLLLMEADLIVDALFGTGFQGALPDGCGFLAEMSNLSKARVYALDIPSGMNADTGFAVGKCLKANQTIAFGCLKPAHLSEDAAEFLGEVEVCDIGIPEEAFSIIDDAVYLIDHDMVLPHLHQRPDDSYKGSFGYLLVVAGSLGMTGAAVLASRAASQCGTGLVYLATAHSLVLPLSAHLTEQVMVPLAENEAGGISPLSLPELLPVLQKSTACVAGCGLKNTEDTRSIIRSIITNAECPIVLDADGINSVVGDINIIRCAKNGLILTPHYGEFSRLTGKTVEYIAQNRVALAKAFAQEYKVTLVLKGATTVVALPDGSVCLNKGSNSGLAKAGSGDLLAGIIGGLLAQGLGINEAAICGVYLHSQAARLTAKRLCKTSMQPSDILNDFYLLFKELD